MSHPAVFIQVVQLGRCQVQWSGKNIVCCFGKWVAMSPTMDLREVVRLERFHSLDDKSSATV